MGGLFSSPSPSPPVIVSYPSAVAAEPSAAAVAAQASQDTAAKTAAAAEVESVKKRKGFKSTILTGPEGLSSPPGELLKQKLGN